MKPVRSMIMLMIVMIFLAGAVGCAPQAAAGPVTVRVLAMEQAGPTVDEMNAIVGEFNKANPDINVEIQMVVVAPAWAQKPVPLMMMFGRPALPSAPVPEQFARFAGLAEAGFDAMYYGKDGEWGADRFWVVADKADLDAPHRPMHLSYDPDLAAFVDIEDVQEKLKIGTYAAVGERLAVLRRVPLAGNDADA